VTHSPDKQKPKRIQRRRTRGWKMPPNTIYVGRRNSGDRGHGRFGNPRRVGQLRGYTAEDAVRDYRRWIDREPSVRSFENVYGKPPTYEEIRAELRGKNLACWCRLCAAHKDGKPLNVHCRDCRPCHVDPLGEIANNFVCVMERQEAR